jgi:hypothetical protein
MTTFTPCSLIPLTSAAFYVARGWASTAQHMG